jgi:Domain of unknown function (DUF4129)
VLDPTRDEAQRWARHELSDPVYAQHEPGWAERALLWLWRHLDDLRLPGGPDGTSGLVVLLALVLLVVLVVWWRTGPMRGPATRARQQAVLQGVTRTAAEHRALADAAAAQGGWQDAVRERFRAVVRALEERGLVDELPGRTAQEVAADAGRALPMLQAQLHAAARVFDDVCYGSRTATSDHDAVMKTLDARVASTTPVAGSVA